MKIAYGMVLAFVFISAAQVFASDCGQAAMTAAVNWETATGDYYRCVLANPAQDPVKLQEDDSYIVTLDCIGEKGNSIPDPKLDVSFKDPGNCTLPVVSPVR